MGGSAAASSVGRIMHPVDLPRVRDMHATNVRERGSGTSATILRSPMSRDELSFDASSALHLPLRSMTHALVSPTSQTIDADNATLPSSSIATIAGVNFSCVVDDVSPR